MISATQRLLESQRSASFSVADVSRESGVSVGGIYGRFHDRESLVREVQRRVNEQMEAEFAVLINGLEASAVDLPSLVVRVTAVHAEHLRSRAPILRALMEASLTDEAIAAEGFRTYAHANDRVKGLLLRFRREIRHPNPGHAIDFWFSCNFEVVASFLGFGRRRSSAATSWPRLVRDLQNLSVAYLTTPPAKGRAAG